MMALRVRAAVAAPVAVPHSHDVHLDAVLAWAWMLRHHSDRLGCLGREVTRAEIIRAHLPVARLRIGAHDVPLCSSWSFAPGACLATGDDMAQRARRISGSCPDRPQFNRGDCVHTPWIEWVCWGQRREVVKALQLVHHVGGLRAHGYGEVTSWAVAEADHAPVDTWVSGGVAQRNLPAEAVATPVVERLAVEPPYWPPCMQVAAVRAGEPAELRDGLAGQLRVAADTVKGRAR